MNNNELIIVVVGETGSGKSFILRELLPNYPNIENITKYTTRKPRIDEYKVLDVKGDVPLEEIEQMEYNYTNPLNNEHYGFKKEEINSTLQKGKIPCIDLSSEDVYLNIVKDYPNKVLLLKIVPYFDEESMKNTFEKQGRSNEEYEERKISLQKPLTDWNYKYDNMREIINPYFLRNCSREVSFNILTKRLESIIQNECNTDLGITLEGSSKTANELYNYLYYYSKNRPIDKEISLGNKKTNNTK